MALIRSSFRNELREVTTEAPRRGSVAARHEIRNRERGDRDRPLRRAASPGLTSAAWRGDRSLDSFRNELRTVTPRLSGRQRVPRVLGAGTAKEMIVTGRCEARRALA